MNSDRRSDDTGETRWARVTELVDAALRHADPDERSRFLHRACGDDQDLRREVEHLLQFEDAHCDLLDRPPTPRGGLGPLMPPGGIEEGPLQPGKELGPYRVERLLGSGGMGVVALVHDADLDRRVALKLLHREKVTPDLLRRFHGERRILARLDHPGIARILGGGAVGGLPFFTMEFVDGEPIDTYCDRRRLSVTARLELVLRVCEALSCAHRNLVVHRDLKPSNLLVTADGQPKLLDFGIAKELGADAAATRTGQQPLTPAFASPEQVRGRGVTTAVDVYSLGVLLYHLLCGHPPYALDGDAFENCRRICEEEPPPPSTRTSLTLEVWRDGTPVGIPPESLAYDRRCDPRSLRRRLRGDLDDVVGKALAKEPHNRYASIDELAADLRRHLDGRPVQARRATLLYRTGKFLRRNRWRLAAAGLVVVLGVGFGVVRERNARQVAALAAERQRATEEARIAEEEAKVLSEFVRTLLRATDPDERRGALLTAPEFLRRAEERARRDLGDQPEELAYQLEAIGLAHQALDHYDAARPLLEASLRLRRQLYRDDHPLVARGLNNLAALVYLLGEDRRAEKLYRLALAMRRRLGQPPEELATIESNLAFLLVDRGELAEAEELYRRLLATRRKAFGDDDPDVSNSPDPGPRSGWHRGRSGWHRGRAAAAKWVAPGAGRGTGGGAATPVVVAGFVWVASCSWWMGSRLRLLGKPYPVVGKCKLRKEWPTPRWCGDLGRVVITDGLPLPGVGGGESGGSSACQGDPASGLLGGPYL